MHKWLLVLGFDSLNQFEFFPFFGVFWPISSTYPDSLDFYCSYFGIIPDFDVFSMIFWIIVVVESVLSHQNEQTGVYGALWISYIDLGVAIIIHHII